MKYDDLEKTKELFDIEEDVPTPINNIEMEGASKNNVTDEFTLGLTDKETEDIKKEIQPETNKKKTKEQKTKKSLKEKWQELSKKKKIITISVLILVLISIITIILILVLKKDDSERPENPQEPDKPSVILEKDNYIYKDGILSLLDQNDQELGTYECKNKDEKLCYVAYYSEEDNFDTIKNIYEDESVIERISSIFNDNYVFIYDSNVEKDGDLVLYNINEQKEEGTYSLVKGFSNSNYVIVKNSNNKYGALEFSENGITEKIKCTFDYLGMMDKDSKIVAKANNKFFIYSKEGKIESKGLAYEIKSYNNKYIVMENNGYYVYDYKSNLVFDEAYEYIKLMDNYVSLVRNSKLYIKDYNNQKYNEEGIELDNTYYNETNIYTKDKVLSSTKKSFDVAVVEDNLEVKYYTKKDKEKAINLSINDGKLSSNYAYLNYFDGTFYFYKEEEKTNLTGTYTCNNKNTVNKDTKTFSNCYIASDTFLSKNEVEVDNSANIGWIPIYNERYVFMMDTMDTKNPTIILYDLKNKKTLSKYSSVDTASYTKEQKLSYKTTNNGYIIAQNKSNKFGVIKIEDEVKSAIAFNYSKIEKLRDYYMAKESSDTYVLLNQTGQEVTSKYGYQIVDYKGNYLKAKDGDKYYIYDFKGNKIDDTAYLSIALYDTFYAVITEGEKKLDIHEYSNASKGLTNPIAIPDGKTLNDFEITKNGSSYLMKNKSTGEVITGELKTDISSPSTPTE